MNRDTFMEHLANFYPSNMSDEQLDALEQFCFKLFDNQDQAFAEIRAQAGREGYLTGISFGIELPQSFIERKAEAYANQIRQQQAKEKQCSQ